MLQIVLLLLKVLTKVYLSVHFLHFQTEFFLSQVSRSFLTKTCKNCLE